MKSICICINAAQVAVITGKSIKTAQSLLRTIKDVNEKKKHHSVTIKEFCEYQGLPFEDVFNLINKIVKDP